VDGFLMSLNRQAEGKGRPLVFFGGTGNRTAVFFDDDIMGDGQPLPRSLADRFGGERLG
jgi:hypothetical protein